jgi:hypothetical protein
MRHCLSLIVQYLVYRFTASSGKWFQLDSYSVTVRLKHFLELLDIAPKVKEGCVKIRAILLD